MCLCIVFIVKVAADSRGLALSPLGVPPIMEYT